MTTIEPSVKASPGFTLIEMVVVVAIVGIIAAFAIPQYQDSVRKSRRIDAQSALLAFSAEMERYHAINGSYQNTGEAPDSDGLYTPVEDVYVSEIPETGSARFYDLRLVFSTVNYTLYAVPKNAQEGDGVLTVDSLGQRLWDASDNGSYDTVW